MNGQTDSSPHPAASSPSMQTPSAQNAMAGPSRPSPRSKPPVADSIDLTADSDSDHGDFNGQVRNGAAIPQNVGSHPPPPLAAAGPSRTPSSQLPPDVSASASSSILLGTESGPSTQVTSTFDGSSAPAMSQPLNGSAADLGHNGLDNGPWDVDDHGDDGEIEVTGANIRSPSVASRTRQPVNVNGAGPAASPYPPYAPGFSPYAAPGHFSPYAFQGAHPGYPGAGGPVNAFVPPMGPSPFAPGAGSSSASAIDLTDPNLRSPPPPPKSSRPVCLGAFDGRAYLLYPSPPVKIGAQAPPGAKHQYEVVPWRGTEFLRVRLKYRAAEGVIQVLLPGSNTYIGDLEPRLQGILVPHLAKGLCRLDGFAVRLEEDAPQFELKINIIMFTLPANITYLMGSLMKNNIFFFDPLPPYDPARHADQPRYENPHGGHDIATQLHHAAQSRTRIANGVYLTASQQAQIDKAKALEVSRVQVDQVYDSLDNAAELEQSDPGPLIKTELFPHQRKALTFFLQRENDNSALRRARKYADKAAKKSRKDSKSATVSENGEADVKSEKGEKAEEEGGSETKSKARTKARENQVLWEAKCDDKGRVKAWRCRITDEERRAKKGDCPNDAKGAILADDMGLGKTLSVVSLIAATRQSAKKWGKSAINAVEEDEGDKPPEEAKSDIKATTFAGRVFGMPSVDSDEEGTSKGKKRKRDETDKRNASLRQSRLSRRSKATLLLCPMSTISNWEDQIKEHWNGKVEVVGGAAGIMPSKVPEKKWKPPKKDDELSSDEEEDFDTLKVYIYHGSSRRADPSFIADFDVVITSYNTLAQEFSKMSAAVGEDETASATPVETAVNSEDDAAGMDGLMEAGLNTRQTKPDVEAEIKVSEVVDALRKPKGKKKGRAGAKPGAEQISPLQAIEWFRVVLDEAHYIKSAATVASKASCYLAADRRVALTGTPIQNKIEDVWALFKFLRLDPVDRKEVFNEYIWDPCKRGDPVGVARLQLVMRCCTLRRTKDSTAEDGRRILNLPPRKEIQLWLDLREDERAAYDQRVDKTKKIVKDLKDQNLMGKSYASVLLEVLRLRQICDHVDLAQSGAVEEDYDGTLMDYDVAIKGIETNGLNLARAQSVVAYLKDGDGAACVSCNYDYSEAFPSFGLVDEDKDERSKLKKLAHKPILTKCLHLYCPRCFKSDVYSDYSKRMKDIGAGRQCGACGKSLRIPADVIEVAPPDSAEAEAVDQAAASAATAPKRATRKKYTRPPGEKPNLSTKMMYLQQQLMEASRRNPHSVHYDAMAVMRQEAEHNEDGLEVIDSEGKPIVTKSVVFSQWTTMLDRIADMLDEIQIKYARLDGTMTRDERSKATDALRNNKKVEVLLVSTRAGGVGLNLTAACRCFLVDPYWNPSVEAQAIDRIHRMGQKRPVTAIKLMIKDSIEEKLDQIQKKKANLAQLSLKNMTRKELMEQKTEELASLFS